MVHESKTLNFKPIELQDKELFDQFFIKYPPLISEFTFTNLFCWRLSKGHEFALYNNHLIISFFDDRKFRRFYQPIGENPADIMQKILLLFPESSFERVEKSIAEKINKEFIVEHDKNMDDYVYSINNLKLLVGDKYSAKRNFIKRFLHYNPKICVLDEDAVQSFLQLQEKWCNLKDCHSNKNTEAEHMAIKEALLNFKKLKFFGMCVYVNNNIEAFAIGEPLNENTFVEHFEKADARFTGIYQYLLNEFVKTIPERFTFINREQDLDVEGIRKTKLSYHPFKFIEKYNIKKIK